MLSRVKPLNLALLQLCELIAILSRQYRIILRLVRIKYILQFSLFAKPYDLAVLNK